MRRVKNKKPFNPKYSTILIWCVAIKWVDKVRMNIWLIFNFRVYWVVQVACGKAIVVSSKQDKINEKLPSV